MSIRRAMRGHFFWVLCSRMLLGADLVAAVMKDLLLCKALLQIIFFFSKSRISVSVRLSCMACPYNSQI